MSDISSPAIVNDRTHTGHTQSRTLLALNAFFGNSSARHKSNQPRVYSLFAASVDAASSFYLFLERSCQASDWLRTILRR